LIGTLILVGSFNICGGSIESRVRSFKVIFACLAEAAILAEDDVELRAKASPVSDVRAT
jgi:hypothetical protein